MVGSKIKRPSEGKEYLLMSISGGKSATLKDNQKVTVKLFIKNAVDVIERNGTFHIDDDPEFSYFTIDSLEGHKDVQIAVIAGSKKPCRVKAHKRGGEVVYILEE